MDIFKFVKDKVTARMVAERYGLKVDRGGMTNCPFHDDRHPSMKADKIFYCFACGAKGDAVKLAEKLLDVGPLEAARTLDRDFGLGYRDSRRMNHAERVFGDYETEELRASETLRDLCSIMNSWIGKYGPGSPEELGNTDPRYDFAVKTSDYVAYMHDYIFLDLSESQRRRFVKRYYLVFDALKAGVDALRRREGDKCLNTQS